MTITDKIAQEAETTISKYEIHGLVCGVASSNQAGNTDVANIVEDLCNKDCQRESLDELVVTSIRELDDELLAFSPLLPDNDLPLRERLVALRDWVLGFLNGYAVLAPSKPPAEVEETIADFAKIADVDMNTIESEEMEKSYSEVIEFLRIGTMLIRENARN